MQDGWGAVAIAECGRAFDYFAWYRPIVVRTGFLDRPSVEVLHDADWLLKSPGTCSQTHHRRIGFDRVAAVRVSLEKLKARVPNERHWGSGARNAIADISMANRRVGMHPGASPPQPHPVEREIFRLSDLTP